MRIKPIKSDRDYRRTLAEIDRLMGALPGTADGDKLDVLATLAEAWEEKHHPIAPPDPIAAIRFALEQRGLSPTRPRTDPRKPGQSGGGVEL